MLCELMRAGRVGYILPSMLRVLHSLGYVLINLLINFMSIYSLATLEYCVRKCDVAWFIFVFGISMVQQTVSLCGTEAFEIGCLLPAP